MKFTAEAFNLPFDEAIEFWKDKVILPKEKYIKLAEEAKQKAFTVAGIQNLNDLETVYNAIEKAIKKGIPYGEFRKEMLKTFQDNGLNEKRLKLVFRQNIQSAFLAGKWKQALETAQDFPYLMYSAVNDTRTTPLCRSLNGKVYHINHPFWQMYFPPNHFGCRSSVRAYSEEMLKRRNLEVEEEMPKVKPPSGFQTNVGISQWGGIIDYYAGQAEKTKGQWIDLGPKTFADYNRPNIKNVPTKLVRDIVLLKGYEQLLRDGLSDTEIRDYYLEQFRKAIGGKEGFFKDPLGETVVLSETLFNHLKTSDGRMRFIPYIPEIIKEPYEIWLVPMKHKASGRVKIRKRYIKVFKDSKNRYMLLVAESKGGIWEGYTVFPTNANYANKARIGELLYGKE